MTRRKSMTGLPGTHSQCNLVLTIVLGGLLAGCGSKAELVSLRGVVTLDGEALKFGGVMFQPPGNLAAQSQIDRDGSFLLVTPGKGPGVAPGRCQVRVTCYESQNQSGTQRKGELMLGKSLIPTKYTRFGTSGIVIDVTPDIEQPLTIGLQSR